MHFHKKSLLLLPDMGLVWFMVFNATFNEGIALDTDPLVMPRGASEIEVRSKQVSST
jgi:hypothetical protein